MTPDTVRVHGVAALDATFAGLRDARRKALVVYLTAGHPSVERSVELLHAVVEAGADVVEVGVPFSDPLADGPVIQASTASAIASGMTLNGTLDLVRRAALAVPVVLFGYLNPFLAAGDTIFGRAHGAGCDGVLVTDLPSEADPEMERSVTAAGLALVRLVAPTTGPDRMRTIVRDAQGFIYVVSRLGVTGARAELPPDLDATIARVRAVTTLPVCVGFGVSSGEQARAVARSCDGVVVGSALVRAAERSVDEAAALVRELRAGIDAA